jgi:hypothetical protein
LALQKYIGRSLLSFRRKKLYVDLHGDKLWCPEKYWTNSKTSKFLIEIVSSIIIEETLKLWNKIMKIFQTKSSYKSIHPNKKLSTQNP